MWRSNVCWRTLTNVATFGNFCGVISPNRIRLAMNFPYWGETVQSFVRREFRLYLYLFTKYIFFNTFTHIIRLFVLYSCYVHFHAILINVNDIYIMLIYIYIYHVVLSLHVNQDIPSVKSHLLFFLNKN